MASLFRPIPWRDLGDVVYVFLDRSISNDIFLSKLYKSPCYECLVNPMCVKVIERGLVFRSGCKKLMKFLRVINGG